MRLPVKRYFTLLATYLKPQWPKVVMMGVLLILGIVLQLVNPRILGYFIDTLQRGGPRAALLQAAGIYIGIALFRQLVVVVNTYFSQSVAWTATNRLRTDLVEHCLSLDMSFHKARTVGEFIERIDGDIDALSNFFSAFVVHLLTNAILLIAILVLFFLIDWRAGLTMTLFSTGMIVLLMKLRARAMKYWRQMREKAADFYGFLTERLSGTADIRANGATDYIMRRFYLFIREWWKVFLRSHMTGATMGAVTLCLFIFGSVLAVSVGLYLWSIHSITIGTVYVMFSYTSLLAEPIREIQYQLQDLQQAEVCIQRVEELLHRSSALQDGEGAELPQGPLAVAFQRASFGYDAGSYVLNDLNFTLTAGKTLGLLGRTGSGKSTLARLLFRLYDPQHGEIFVGGVPIKTLRLKELRHAISIVTQDVQLFRASVRDNLTFFHPVVEDERVIEAIEDVGLGSWYRALPAGLDTELGSDGGGMSAGQAQLLAFARVFLTNPGLVILDEASSRLDPATERLIEQAIDKLLQQRSAIVIAHRLSTIQRVDTIMLLEDGRIVEYGARDVLAGNPGSRFAQLLRTGMEGVTV